ncbi:MAG TPA: DUF2528 family protein [Mucilaginibacter sp.]|nr:DUF2528 family protein [Mucilaginibacter sp.]
MSKKTYTVIYLPTIWECRVEIDHEEKTLEAIRLMVEFWTGYEYRLSANNGDYVKTFLQQLAREINYIQAEHNYNLKGVTDEFKNREGWCPMDGSYGIVILDTDDFEFEHDDYEIKEETTDDQSR